MRDLLAIFLLTALGLNVGTAEDIRSLILNSNKLHLGIEGKPEWEEFAGKTPDAHRWEARFQSESNRTEATLFIRQDDVRHDWGVELNGKRIGKLFLMEADLIHHLSLPVGALREGENVLSIIPPKEVDDVFLHDIWIDPRPVNEALGGGTLAVNVKETDSAKPTPCRITVVNEQGALAALAALTNGVGAVALRPGVLYTGTGTARVSLAPGGYTVFASRGFEYSVATQHVRILAGETATAKLQLQREVATPGLVSCDTHVHTFTHSRHGDSTLDERMLTLAGEGIELPIATEHNLHADYSEAAERMGVEAFLTPVTGNEVTTPAGHFNIFPVLPEARVADFRITDWPTLMTSMRAMEGVRVVILNHPRNVHQGFQPFAATNFNAVTGENKRGAEFSFDAMEVLNSSAQQSDYLLVYRDWFALWNHGYRITGVGSSDGHDVSRYIVGQGRTYISVPDEVPGRIDVAAACSNLVAGRVAVSMGLLTQITVDGRFGAGDLATRLGDNVRVRVKVLGPSWVQATNVTLFANGLKLREEDLHSRSTASRKVVGEQALVEWVLPRPAHDVHLVAIATGPGVTAPFWAIPRPYQPTSTRWEGRVIGSTNPILLDADNDGKFTAAREYAKQVAATHGKDSRAFLSALAPFDEAVAAQAAGLMGERVEERDFQEALAKAPAPVRKGFAAYAAAR